MKKIMMILASIVVFASCKNTDKQGVVMEDTRQATIDSMKAVAEKQRVIDSMNIEVAKAEKAQAIAESKRQTVIVRENAATTTTVEKKRKGLSGAATGALIGAGVGAITGATVSKEKKGQGAIIGGLAGAGVGAGTGAIIDAEKKKKEQQ